jgi:hypothetical protein
MMTSSSQLNLLSPKGHQDQSKNVPMIPECSESEDNFNYIPKSTSSRATTSRGSKEYNTNAPDNTTGNFSQNRSTLPLNPFYGDFISKIKSRKMDQVEKILTKNTHKFYGPIDEMGKTALHLA